MLNVTLYTEQLQGKAIPTKKEWIKKAGLNFTLYAEQLKTSKIFQQKKNDLKQAGLNFTLYAEQLKTSKTRLDPAKKQEFSKA